MVKNRKLPLDLDPAKNCIGWEALTLNVEISAHVTHLSKIKL
jgi:hypothetical protein